jgi:hypothetical protein
MLSFLSLLVGPVVDLVRGVGSFVGRRIERAEELSVAKAQAEIAVVKAEAEARAQVLLANAQTDNQADLLLIQQQDRSFKDEWFTYLLSVPLVMAFVPSLAPYVDAGFAVLARVPDWYLWMVTLAVATAFGYRRLMELVTTVRRGRR